MGKHANARPITEPTNLSELLDNPKVKNVRIRTTVQEHPLEPRREIEGRNGRTLVQGSRPEKPKRAPLVREGSHRTVAAPPSAVERALAIHRIARAVAFLILCIVAGTAWTGLLISAWDIVKDIWWCWVFVAGSALGVVLFSYDTYVAVKYRRHKQAEWKGL